MSLAFVLLSIAAGVGAGFAAAKWAPFDLPWFAPAAEAHVEAAPASSAAPSSAPSAPAAPSAPTSAPAAPSQADAVACLASSFPGGSFKEPDDVAKLVLVCEEPNVVAGAPRLKELVVRAGRGRTTDGMREWAVLGYHELAAYAALRGRCCTDGAKLEVPPSPKSCDAAMDASLVALAELARPEAPEAGIDAAIKRYRQAVGCVVKNGVGKQFGGEGLPGGGEATTFRQVLDRARAAK